MNALSIGDALSIFDNVKDRVKTVTKKPNLYSNLDYSYITPTLLAVGKLADENVSELLNLVQGNLTMIWNLSGKPLSSRVKSSLSNRVVDAPWITPGQFTHLPTVSCVHSLCYSIKSWLDISVDNVAVIHCGNGKSRTGILIACLLKYIKAFERTSQAFEYFNSARSDSTTLPVLAPSYRQFFENIDKSMEVDSSLSSPRRLHLKSMTIGGLPVDEKPCVEILSADGVIFSSYSSNANSGKRESIWSSEFGDGIFRIGQDIIGDFSVICRFGGQHLRIRDHTTLIFKYQHNTAFIDGEIELNRSSIDVNPQYTDSLDFDLFVVHLIFANNNERDNFDNNFVPGTMRHLTSYHQPGKASFEAGLDELSKHSNLIPDPAKSNELINRGYSAHHVPVALQLSNNNLEDASELLEKMDNRMNELSYDRPSSGNRRYSVQDGTLLMDNSIHDDEYDEPYYDDSHHHSNSNSHSSSPLQSPSNGNSNMNRRHSDHINNASTRISSVIVSYTPPSTANCSSCSDQSASKMDQLVPCSNCQRYFHTFCFGGRRIPFTMKTQNDQQIREKYVAKHYGSWRCSSCPEANSSSNQMIGRNSLIDAGHNVLQGRGGSRGSLNSTLNLSALKNSGYGMNRALPNKNVNNISSLSSASPSTTSSMSAHDQMAMLLGILSASGVSVESLLSMGEQQQRETLIAATRFHNQNVAGSSFEDDDSGGTDSYGVLSSRQSFDSGSTLNGNGLSNGYDGHDGYGYNGGGQGNGSGFGSQGSGSGYPNNGNSSMSGGSSILAGGITVYRGLQTGINQNASNSTGSSVYGGVRDGNGNGSGGGNGYGNGGTGDSSNGFGNFRGNGILSSLGDQRTGNKRNFGFGKMSGFGKEIGSSKSDQGGSGMGSGAGGGGGSGFAGLNSPLPSKDGSYGGNRSLGSFGGNLGGNSSLGQRSRSGSGVGSSIGGGGGVYGGHFGRNQEASGSRTGSVQSYESLDNSPGASRNSGSFSDRMSPTSSFRKSTFRKLGGDRFEGYSGSGGGGGSGGSYGGDDGDDGGDFELGIPLPSKHQVAALLSRRGRGFSVDKGESVKMKDDAKFGKYIKMVQIGLQKNNVAQKMVADGVAVDIEEALKLLEKGPDAISPSKEKADQAKEEEKKKEEAEKKEPEVDKDKVAIKDHPKFEKYFKMLKAGIPKEAVKAKMTQDGVDPNQLDLDPEVLVPKEKENKVAIKDHPKFEKYFKMLKVGLPREAVKAKMTQEGVDPNQLDLDPETLIPLDDEGEKVPIKSHPKFEKYFKMLKVGLPKEAVKAKMTQEGVDPNQLDLDPDTLIPLNDKPKQGMVAAQDHPKYSKFFKMLKVGLPKDAIKAKMIQEKVNPDIIDKEPTDMIPLEDVKMIAVKDHPKYAKYFKMLKVGLPKESVKAKMREEGVNPDMLDKDPDEMIPEEDTTAAPAPTKGGFKLPPRIAKGGSAEDKKSTVRKKKLFWKALDASKITSDSLWYGQDQDIDLDEAEFNQLFVDDVKEDDLKKKKPVAESQKKKKICLIDMKRGQNAGIALARVKVPFVDLRSKISVMDDADLTIEQLQNLQDYLPTFDEIRVLKAFNGDKELLGVAEKYMMVMMELPTASNRIECMKYKQQFLARFFELKQTAKKILDACEEVKSSVRLKRVLKTILKVGNQMNDGDKNMGFSLDSLLKLQSQKAFDNKTTILDYVINLIYRNDRTALDFPQDLASCEYAARLHLDTVQTERTALRKGLEDCLNILKRLTDEDTKNAALASQKAASEDEVAASSLPPVPPPKLPSAKIGEFFEKAKLLLGELDKIIDDRVKSKYSSLLTYFGEDPGMASYEFFFTLTKFKNEFTKARENVERVKKAEEKRKNVQAKQEQIDAAKKAKAALNVKPATSVSVAPEGQNPPSPSKGGGNASPSKPQVSKS